MEMRRRVLGPENPDTLTSMANLASTYRNQGRWTEAEKLNVQVMEIRKIVLGPEHPDTLTSMANLASTYRNQGRWTEAEKLFVQAMETSKRVLGPEHPDTLTSMANLALTYRNQGRWTEAEKLFVQVMETRKTVLGPEHPDTLTSMANLASTYRNQGRWAEAEKLDIQVMETGKTILGPEHPDTLTSVANLALTYWNQGRWTEAEKLGVQVMEIRKRVLGPEHPDTLISMANLASTYRDQGRWNEAEELSIQVMETQKKVLGPQHPDSVNTINNLAFLYQNQRRWKEAQELLVQITATVPDSGLIPGGPTINNINKRLEGNDSESYTDSTFINSDYKAQQNLLKSHTISDRSETGASLYIDRDFGLFRTPGYDDDIQSVESDKADIESLVSWKRTAHEVNGENLIRNLLVQNTQLTPLYRQALARMDKGRFVNNVRRLLKVYYLRLCQDAQTNLERETVRLLRRRWGRVRIAQAIADFHLPENDEIRQQLELKIRDSKRKGIDLDKWITETRLALPREAAEVEVITGGDGKGSEELNDDSEGCSSEKSETEDDILRNIEEMKGFLSNSTSFKLLIRDFRLLLLPISLQQVITSIPKSRIWLTPDNDLSFCNKVKGSIEDYTTVEWNWWPLRPRMRLLQPNQTRLHWLCVSSSSILATIEILIYL
jgi:tetratricopeptide (TPR) repeat protein